MAGKRKPPGQARMARTPAPKPAPKPAAKPAVPAYNPLAYVPGGATTAVATATQKKGYQTGPAAVKPQDRPEPGYDPNAFVPPPESYTDPSSATSPTIDWASYLGQFGLPTDVQNEVNAIFGRTPDFQQAVAIAMGYIRGTGWYATEYAGIAEARAKGIVTDERDYRALRNATEQLFKQHGREFNTSVFSAYMREGVDFGTIKNRLDADALALTLGVTLPEGVFGTADVRKIAQYRAGVGGQEGQYLSQFAEYAQNLAPYFKQLYGTNPGRGDLESHFKAGTPPQMVLQKLQAAQGANVPPGLAALLTPDELTQLADHRAGLMTQRGAALEQFVDYAGEIDSVYRRMNMTLTRGDLDAAYRAGDTADVVARRFDATANTGTLAKLAPEGFFSADELKRIGDEQAGLGADSQARYLSGLASYAREAAPVFGQYGKGLDRAALEDAYRKGESVDTLGRRFAGEAITSVYKDDVQYAAGAFGDGRLSDQELTAYGQQQAGLDSELGMRVQRRLELANERVRKVFSGDLATGRLASLMQPGRRPDIGR